MASEGQDTPTEIVRRKYIYAEETLLRQIREDLRAQRESHFCLVEVYDEEDASIYQQCPQKLSKSYW